MPTPTQEQGARELVERARAGDQNAMAILQMVGENARQGQPKARAAEGAIKRYIADNPAPLTNWAEGAEVIGILKNPENPDDGLFETLLTLPQYEDARLVSTACVVLSHHEPWTKGRIHALDSLMEPGCDEQRQFRMGVEGAGEARVLGPAIRSLPPELQGFLCAGHCLGTARKLQLARRADVPLTALCRDLEWELGCV
jgi:hypothetical protein